MINNSIIHGKKNSHLESSVAILQPTKKIEIIDPLLIEIFRFLNTIEIGTVSQVSKQWKFLAEDKKLWLDLTVFYCFDFQEKFTFLQPSKKFIQQEGANFKQWALRKRASLLQKPYIDGGIPSMIAKLFGSIENVLALPKGSVLEEYLKEQPSNFSLVLPQWQCLGDNVQDDPICRIDANGEHFIAIRYIINFEPKYKWTKRERTSPTNWKYVDKIGGSLESKIVLKAGKHFGSVDECWHATDHSEHDCLISKTFLNFEDLEEPKTFEWLKKLISGIPCGIHKSKLVWNSFIGRIRHTSPDTIHYVEGPSFLKDGQPVCQLWTGSKRTMSSLNIIEDYIPKDRRNFYD